MKGKVKLSSAHQVAQLASSQNMHTLRTVDSTMSVLEVPPANMAAHWEQSSRSLTMMASVLILKMSLSVPTITETWSLINKI
jgi:hypothetical protein